MVMDYVYNSSDRKKGIKEKRDESEGMGCGQQDNTVTKRKRWRRGGRPGATSGD